MFKEQILANKVNLPRLYDLFNVKQREGELLREYLNRFYVVSVRLQTQDEEMVVVAFVKGMATSPFSDSLIRNPAETLSKVCERATTHIEVVLRKNGSSRSKQPRHKENNRQHSAMKMKHPPRREWIRGMSRMLPRRTSLRQRPGRKR